MRKSRKIGSLIFLCLKFILFVLPLVALWWYLLPYYAEVLLQISGGILVSLFRFPIDSGHIIAKGLLNTETYLVFVTQGNQRALPIALLVTNVPPYWALVFATAGITWLRRIWILLFGSAILISGHVLFLVLALNFGKFLAGNPEIPTAIAQFYLTLPFLLWIVLAYWDKIAGYMGDAAQQSNTGAEDGSPQDDA